MEQRSVPQRPGPLAGRVAHRSQKRVARVSGPLEARKGGRGARFRSEGGLGQERGSAPSRRGCARRSGRLRLPPGRHSRVAGTLASPHVISVKPGMPGQRIRRLVAQLVGKRLLLGRKGVQVGSLFYPRTSDKMHSVNQITGRLPAAPEPAGTHGPKQGSPGAGVDFRAHAPVATLRSTLATTEVGRTSDYPMCTAASGVGGHRPADSASRSRETASGERMTAITLIRPPQRSQTSTSTSKIRRSRSLHAMRFHGGTFESPCLHDSPLRAGALADTT